PPLSKNIVGDVFRSPGPQRYIIRRGGRKTAELAAPEADGANFLDYLKEAHRCLKLDGHLWIA
ncbi:MAG: hypothetical protein KGR16_07570, partial [Verrucomicrobia bacterium]|nr:hypothetical protein [Verrucomicrobiota bacterium]